MECLRFAIAVIRQEPFKEATLNLDHNNKHFSNRLILIRNQHRRFNPKDITKVNPILSNILKN